MNSTRVKPDAQTIADYDNRDDKAWLVSFAATMVPFTAFWYVLLSIEKMTIECYFKS